MKPSDLPQESIGGRAPVAVPPSQPPAGSQPAGAGGLHHISLWDAWLRIGYLLQVADSYNEHRPPGLPSLNTDKLHEIRRRLDVMLGRVPA